MPATEKVVSNGKKQSKVCAVPTCLALFSDCLLFMTCPACRRPLPDGIMGCHNWEGRYAGTQDNPRVTRHQEGYHKQLCEILK